MRRCLRLAVLSLLAAQIGAASADSPILYPADQFGRTDLVPTQAGGAAASLLESLGTKTDRFEPLSRFREDDPFRQAGRSVGRLDIEVRDSQGHTGVATCTATLISPDTIITNAHCIPGTAGSGILRAEIRFGYLRLGDPDSMAFPVDVPPLESNAGLDYSILRVRGNPAPHFAVADRPQRAARDNESLYLIHHPGGQPQKLTRAFCRAYPDQAVARTLVRHQCDTLPGSSGSLLFALSDGAIIGLHHSGGLTPNDDLSFNRGTDIEALRRQSKLMTANTPPPKPEPAKPAQPVAIAPPPIPPVTKKPPDPLKPRATDAEPKAGTLAHGECIVLRVHYAVCASGLREVCGAPDRQTERKRRCLPAQ